MRVPPRPTALRTGPRPHDPAIHRDPACRSVDAAHIPILPLPRGGHPQRLEQPLLPVDLHHRLGVPQPPRVPLLLREIMHVIPVGPGEQPRDRDRLRPETLLAVHIDQRIGQAVGPAPLAGLVGHLIGRPFDGWCGQMGVQIPGAGAPVEHQPQPCHVGGRQRKIQPRGPGPRQLHLAVRVGQVARPGSPHRHQLRIHPRQVPEAHRQRGRTGHRIRAEIGRHRRSGHRLAGDGVGDLPVELPSGAHLHHLVKPPGLACSIPPGPEIGRGHQGRRRHHLPGRIHLRRRLDLIRAAWAGRPADHDGVGARPPVELDRAFHPAPCLPVKRRLPPQAHGQPYPRLQGTPQLHGRRLIVALPVCNPCFFNRPRWSCRF